LTEQFEGEFVEEPLLKLKSVSPEFVPVLKDAGYYTVESLAIESPHVLFERVGERRGFSIEKARGIVREARGCLKIEIMTATDLLKEEESRLCYPTGSKCLDELLGGGIREQEITEAAGVYESGKTEIALTVALMAAAQFKANTLFFDSEGSFSAKRLCEMADARGLNPEETVPHVHYSKVYGSEHLVFLLENAHKPIRERNIHIIIVDSLVSPFRAEYPGRELLAPRQQLINRCLRSLLNYARVYKIAVLTTEQVLASPIAYTYDVRPENLNPPVGGHVVSHLVNNRIYLTMGPGSTRIATLIASSYLPRASTKFMITKAGIEDAPQ
jgi:DNA repair protein RadA